MQFEQCLEFMSCIKYLNINDIGNDLYVEHICQYIKPKGN